MAVRFDRAELRPLTRDPITGFLRGDAYIGRTGVFPYFRDGKIVRELRHPDDVFAPASLLASESAPVTLGHPTTPNQLITSPEQAREFIVGNVASPRVDDGKIRAPILLTHADAIDAVEEQKIREISPGYTCDFDPTPGVYEGQKYDGRQKNIRPNHFALLKAGRQGPEVGVRLDAADAYAIDEPAPQESPMAEIPMTKVRIDSTDFEVPSLVAPHLSAAVDRLTARVDALQAELTKAKATATALPEATAAHLERVVQAHGLFGDVPEASIEKLVRADRKDLERLMLKHLSPDLKLEGRSDEYIAARLDAALELRAGEQRDEQKGNDSLAALAAAITPRTTTTAAQGGAQGAPRVDAKDPHGLIKAKAEADKAWSDVLENRRKLKPIPGASV